jgi:hypothetical protein
MTANPVNLFIDWLTSRPKDARVIVAIDADRLVCDSGLFGRNAVDDMNGRRWQIAVFRGDDLAFRLRFRKASSAGPTVIVLMRGQGTDGKIDVSLVADILSKNEGGEPLDLSLPAFCRRLCPKINFPPLELRRYKDAVLACLETVPEAASKIIEKWGRPDDWGRGQVAAMLILASHPDITLRNLWPDEIEPIEFVAHALRLLLGNPDLAGDHEIVLDMILEAARPQVRGNVRWFSAAPEELAALLVLRRYAAELNLQNPANQLSGLQIFSPEIPISDMEPLLLQVANRIRTEASAWSRIDALAESFLTPKRIQRVMDIIPAMERTLERLAIAVKRPDVAPVVLKQHFRLVILEFIKRASSPDMAWVRQLADHPLGSARPESLTPRALECRSAIEFLLLVRQIEERLAVPLPDFQHGDHLLEWYVQTMHHRLEIDTSQALHHLEACGDSDIATAGHQFLFGGEDDLNPSIDSLKGRVRARLEKLDQQLAGFVRESVDGFARGQRSAVNLIRDRIGAAVEAAKRGSGQGRVWILLFDGMRFDTWEQIVQPILAEHFTIERHLCFTVLPSFTQVARTSLFAGCLPTEWRGYRGNSTKDEEILLARNLGLTQQERSKLRFVTEADTAKARMGMGFAASDAKEINLLIYPISDDCHDFRGDLSLFNNKIRTEIIGDKTQGVRGILDDLLRRVRPEDTILATSDHGFAELLAGDSVVVTEDEVKKAGRVLQEDVRFRYVRGLRPTSAGDAVEVPGAPDSYFVAVGRTWFRREGSKNTPRYEHGGLSLSEVVIPAVVLRRITEKEARAEFVDIPAAPLIVDEDENVEFSFAVENSGNVPIAIDLQVESNLGEELLSYGGKLLPGSKHGTKVVVTGKYSETAAHEPDPMGTLTAVTLRLRHTDTEGNWRNALDGVVTIGVRVKPKKTRLTTDALKGFDDI